LNIEIDPGYFQFSRPDTIYFYCRSDSGEGGTLLARLTNFLIRKAVGMGTLFNYSITPVRKKESSLLLTLAMNKAVEEVIFL
jgi:hypothetical protein